MAGEGNKRPFTGDQENPTKKLKITSDGSTAGNAIITVPANFNAATVYGKSTDGGNNLLVWSLPENVSEVSVTFKVKGTSGNSLFGSQDIDNRVQNFQNFDQDSYLPSLPQTARHPSHPDHNLQRIIRKELYTCNGCKMLRFGPRYSCKDCSSFNLHEKCMSSTEDSPASHHEFFGDMTFKFYYQRPGKCTHANCRECNRYCEACAKPTEGFVYYQEGEDRGITFHPCCFNLPSKLSAEDIEYELCANLSSKCLLCKRKQLKGAAIGNTGWAYVSKCKEYNFHVFCIMKTSVEKGKNGDLSLVLKNKKLTVGKKVSKKLFSLFKMLLSILLGDPVSLALNVVDLLCDFA